MKRLSRLILILMIGAITFSCSSTKYRVIHKALTIPNQCNFEKFTEHEKGLMTEAIGRKIYRNQENCRIRQERIKANIKAHNESHTDEQ